MEIQPVKRNWSRIKTRLIKGNKLIRIIIISITIFLALYLGMSLYFNTHFYFGSTINNINAFGKTVEQLDKALALKCEAYTLELIERNGVTEQIKSADIGLEYNAKEKIQDLKDKQQSFRWVLA
ncbi:MAG: hypothetical protein MUO60_17680, partial [Clostridiaceae bacterium]|nr:hypothetical protein [Clostridiaceae bacterium]